MVATVHCILLTFAQNKRELTSRVLALVVSLMKHRKTALSHIKHSREVQFILSDI